ncbi:MAG TPA: hypothetical protein DEA08_21720 [Planctomycetes bacterium]|nr:hypothetical protein [Planctomycetota bacterium]
MQIKAKHPPCPYCHGPVEPRAIKAACDGCMAWHHKECWDEHGTCAACAFPEPPLVAPAFEIPSQEAREIREALRLGNPLEAQELCLELHEDERQARRLYEALLDEARQMGQIESAKAQNERIVTLLAEGEITAAQDQCLEAAGGDEVRAIELYEYLLSRADELGLIERAAGDEDL